MTFGNRLRAARIAAGVSQAAVGMSLDPVKYRSSITRYEGGQDEPSLSTVEQLAAALGVTPCWLAFGTIKGPCFEPEQQGCADCRGGYCGDKYEPCGCDCHDEPVRKPEQRPNVPPRLW